MTDCQSTHALGCWDWGPSHYECAVGQIERDEALLRQALEVLSRAHQTAMEQTLRARVPECSAFAGIAQDLDFVVAAVRDRLGASATGAGQAEIEFKKLEQQEARRANRPGF